MWHACLLTHAALSLHNLGDCIQVKSATTLRIATAIRHAHIEMSSLAFVTDVCAFVDTLLDVLPELWFGLGMVCWTFDDWKNFALCLKSCL